MLSDLKYSLVKLIKEVVYPKGEPYSFNGRTLKFKANCRPVKRKFLNYPSDVVRNDVLQINYLENTFKPSDILWDIGSHAGHYAVFAASIVKGENQVFSFEPDSSARKSQMETIQLNKFSPKIKVFDFAVSDQDGVIQFLDQGGNANSHILKKDSGEDGKITKMNCRSLNSLLKELPAPSFVKIDTEGAEIDILKGASELLKNSSVKFICELHPFAWDHFGVTYSEFTDILAAHGRTITLLDDRKSLSELPYYGTVLF
jgi:FkbM family methyltransferase